MNCVVSGSFDPITVGHVDIIKRAAKMFDKVYVLIAKTSSKANAVLTYDDKVDIIRDSIDEIITPYQAINYEILPIDNTLIDTMQKLNVNVIVRGLRNGTDLIYEMDMSSVNRDLNPDIETVYFPCRPELSYVSSSMVRELCKLKKYNEAKKYCCDTAVNKIYRKSIKLVALTGGIACGKSEVQKMFEKRGWFGIDLDVIANNILSKHYYDVAEMMNINFGNIVRLSVTDSAKEFKEKLANLVFSNSKAKEMLESYMHPLILSDMWNTIYNSYNDKVVVQVPLLFETGLDSLFDKIVCVYATEKIQLDRMSQKCNMTLDNAKARIDSQMPIDKKMRLSDYRIENAYGLGRLQTLTDNVIDSIEGV